MTILLPLLESAQRSRVNREVRGIQNLNTGMVFAIKWCHGGCSASVHRVVGRVEPQTQMIDLDRGVAGLWSALSGKTCGAGATPGATINVSILMFVTSSHWLGVAVGPLMV
jgi:hypothetical protein